jgi:hypothetical protein
MGFTAKSSLALWQRRAKFRKGRRDHWDRLLTHANQMVAKRKQQVAENANARPTVMYDSVTVSAIPGDAKAVAGYTAGRFPTLPTLQQHFPKARKLSIAVASRFDAECLDVEPGDATPEVAAAWVKRQHARGVGRPVIYCSVSSAQTVLSKLAGAGIARSQIRLWTAHFTFKPHRCGPECGFGFSGRADATQWTDKALGRNLDESLVDPSFWD